MAKVVDTSVSLQAKHGLPVPTAGVLGEHLQSGHT